LERLPPKDGKATARKAWKQVSNKPPIDHILEAIRVQKKSRQWKQEGDRFIPKLVNWILDRRWEDVPVGKFKKTPTPVSPGYAYEEPPIDVDLGAELTQEKFRVGTPEAKALWEKVKNELLKPVEKNNQ
jgi:hypothetical protein